jgi:hypothetical protein
VIGALALEWHSSASTLVWNAGAPKLPQQLLPSAAGHVIIVTEWIYMREEPKSMLPMIDQPARLVVYQTS